MKRINIAVCTVLMTVVFMSCQDREQPPGDNPTAADMTAGKVDYDSLKAIAYGADPYGMKKYVFAFLYKGPNRDQDSARTAELQRAHLQNIMKMAEEGKLVLAGPFLDDSDLRGIYVFNVETLSEAEALTNTDPAIQEGILRMELKEWYGSAALMGLNEIHQTLAKQSVAD